MSSSQGRNTVTSTAGYDIAKEFHWLAALDDRGRLLLSHRVDNTPEAIEYSISELHPIEAGHGVVTIGLDIFGGIAGRLAEGFTCVHVPGLAVNRARRATRGGEDKSDPRDAKVIAEQVMLRDDLRIVELPEETTVELRLLVSHRTTLVTDATARTARLRGLLTGIHPGLERVTDPARKSSLILLGHYVTPAEIRRAGAARIAD
jgi:transposase